VSRPRLLFLSCHLPWPPISGGRRRELELLKRISQRFEVHLVAVSKTPGEDRMSGAGPVHVDVFPANPPEIPDVGVPVQVARHRSPAATQRVGQLLAEQRFDLVHVEGFYLMQHVPASTRTPVLLCEQNIEYQLERQQAAVEDDPLVLTRSIVTELAERESWRRASALAAVTPEDAAVIEVALPDADVRLVPDGADHISSLRAVEGRSRPARPDAPLILMLGNFAYAPNVDGARYLHDHILPRVRERLPDTVLWLVGHAPPPEVKAWASDGVTVTGQVDEIEPYLDAADVVLCPLRIGGGIKVKTLEAMRRGKPVVSTSIGAQGLDPGARQALAIADDTDGFVSEVVDLLTSPGRRSELGTRAAQASLQMPTWDEAGDALMNAYSDLLRRSARPSADLSHGGGASVGLAVRRGNPGPAKLPG
jgi:glycosyltransferase involved in cell wall biosynthesis